MPPGWSPTLLSYKTGAGDVAIDRINPAGQGTAGVWTGTWTAGWDVIRSLGILGQLLEYKSIDGTAAIDQLDRAGQGSSEIWRAIWNPGYTTVVPFSLHGDSPCRTALDFFAFRYNAATGEVSTAAIGTYRQQTSNIQRLIQAGQWVRCKKLRPPPTLREANTIKQRAPAELVMSP